MAKRRITEMLNNSNGKGIKDVKEFIKELNNLQAYFNSPSIAVSKRITAIEGCMKKKNPDVEEIRKYLGMLSDDIRSMASMCNDYINTANSLSTTFNID